jgi:phospholipase C
MEIAHVVVLMLENRSFDSMLGRLYPASESFRGLTGQESNNYDDEQIGVWTSTAWGPDAACIPTPDPSEDFADMTDQIFGTGLQPPSPATMDGFVINYMKEKTNDPRAVMHGFSPAHIPVLSTLAATFGVSDCWHASAPNQTWPNRFFAHTGTAGGYVNNSPPHFLYTIPTIFNRLAQKQCSWRIYHHDFPQVAALAQIWSELPEHLYSFEGDFMADAMAGRLPNYSFIEPRYFSNPVLNRMPNDQHPPHNVSYGERLIARCFDALRNGAAWNKTLFIITYDEHGGIYDHVPPPKSVSPDGLKPDGFSFDRYGVRVPAVLISPWIAPASIVRPPSTTKWPFDHTSILSTLRKLFSLGTPLSERDAIAPDLLGALTLSEPSNHGPTSLILPTISPSPSELIAAHQSRPNSLQRSLAELAFHLPAGTADVPGHQKRLSEGELVVPSVPTLTVQDALSQAQAGLARFLSSPRGTL